MSGLFAMAPLRGWSIEREKAHEQTARGALLQLVLYTSQGRAEDALRLLRCKFPTVDPCRATEEFSEILANAIRGLPAELERLLTEAKAPPAPARRDVTCPSCNGKGYTRTARNCTTCGNTGRVREDWKPPSELHKAAVEGLGKRCTCKHTSREHDPMSGGCRACGCKAFEEQPEALPERYGGPSELAQLQEEFNERVDEVADRPSGGWPFKSPKEVVRAYLAKAKDRRPKLPQHKPESGDPPCLICGLPCYSRNDPDRTAEACRKKTVGSKKRAHERCYQAAKAYGEKHGW